MSGAALSLPAGVGVSTPAASCCFKGREAPRALESAGVELPARPNSWRHGAAGWCLRLGSGEYLLAHDDAAVIGKLRARVAASELKCHALLRSDLCIELHGALATERLLQVCDIDERQLLRQPDALALVMLADVSVALHAIPDAGPAYRIWCDPTYAAHVLETFARIAAYPTAITLKTHPRQYP